MLRHRARLYPAEIDLGEAGLIPPRIALVRHPPIRGGVGRCYGRLDLPLVEQDFSALVARLSPMRGARVWTSPLARCRLLAEALIPHPVIDHRLIELDFGDWEGMSWDDIPRSDLDRWALDLAGFAPPGGESGNSLVARVTAFWEALDAGSHIVVTHGGPLRVLMALAEGRAVDLARPAPGLGSVTLIPATSHRPAARNAAN